MTGLGLRGPTLILAGRSAIRLLSETWNRTFSEAGITHAVLPQNSGAYEILLVDLPGVGSGNWLQMTT